jgi:hypothetical protein
MAIVTESGKAAEKVEPEDRKPAPPIVMNPEDLYRDERKAQIKKLDEEFPQSKHSYADPRVVSGAEGTQFFNEMQRKGQEVVVGEHGPLHHLGDPVVKQDRKEWERTQNLQAQLSARAVEELTDTEDEMTQFHSPKKPKISKAVAAKMKE